MGRSSREKREKREVEATKVVNPLRYIVKSDTWEAEVLVECGRVMTADEPLEDYVGDPWDALADHARGHGWAVRDKAAQAGEPPKITRVLGMTIREAAAAKISPSEFFDLPQILPKKPPPGMAKSVLIGNPNADVGWQTPIDEIEKEMKRVAEAQAKRDEEMKRLVQEFAVRKAQQGSLDVMNAAIFPSGLSDAQKREIQTLIRIAFDELRRTMVQEIAREVVQYLGINQSHERDRAIAREIQKSGQTVGPPMTVMPKTFDEAWSGMGGIFSEPSRRRQK